MLLLFPMFPMFEPLSAEGVAASRRFVAQVLDFAENGRPTTHEDWTELREGASYLEMGSEYRVVQGTLPEQERVAFWRGLGVHFNHTLGDRVRGGEGKEEL